MSRPGPSTAKAWLRIGGTVLEPPTATEIAWDAQRDARRKTRKCLRCGTDFDSAGPQHRLCRQCRWDATHVVSPFEP